MNEISIPGFMTQAMSIKNFKHNFVAFVGG